MDEYSFLSKLNPIEMCSSDPLIKFLLKISHQKWYRVTLISFFIYGTFMLSAGFLISIYYSRVSTKPFLSIFDSRELPFAIFIYLICGPAAWTFYVLEPIMIIQIFRDLVNYGVIGKSKSHFTNIDQFLKIEMENYNKPKYPIIFLIITIFTIIGWALSTLPPSNNPFLFKLHQTWWQINPFYLVAIWIPLAFIPLYMVLLIVIRRVITVRIINKLLDSFEIIPKLFHPDRANGLYWIQKAGHNYTKT